MIKINFSQWRNILEEPIISGLNEVYEDDVSATLTTIAFLFGQTSPMKLTRCGLQTSMLALYAGGASVQLCRQELWDLLREPKQYAELFSLPEHSSYNASGALLSFTVNQALKRAMAESIPFGSRVDLPVGFSLIRLHKEAESLDFDIEQDAVRNLRTCAFLNLNPNPMAVDQASLSLAMLAIWAAGARVEMSTAEYLELRTHVERGLALAAMEGKNKRAFASQARFVLARAALRAAQE